MKRSRGSARSRDRVRSASGEAAARERVAALFARVDRLTPDELARIGLERRDPAQRQQLLDEVDAIARRTGRLALLDEVVRTARDTLLERIGSGTFHPTWVALNWGLSSGSTESRVAVVEAVEDAAAAAVVADLAAPDLVAALSLDAEHVTSMATGSASDGAFSRAVAAPASAEYRSSPVRWVAIALGALSIGAVAFWVAAVTLGTAVGVVAFVFAAVIVVRLAGQRTGTVDGATGD